MSYALQLLNGGAGILKLWPLTATVATVRLPLPWAEAWQATLFHWLPFDAAKAEVRQWMAT